ncbi:YitT family protein [Rubeoparvulum massiliense]|uniref:YitT family protein n=1 Tax=Rubeoparvulum massiliense TaxID=1631346 RepID=UPI00065DE048|nr:YitT family protein [Rubeoparvulum massiliense]
MQPTTQSLTTQQKLKEYLYITAGAFLVALAFNLFLIPARIASGGVSGLSIILFDMTGIRPAYIQWGLNIPLFIAGVLILGKQFGIKTLYGTLVLPFFVFLTDQMVPLSHDPLLSALFGGLGVGAGIGLVFRGKASTGGTDLAAQMIHKYTHWSLGNIVMMIDGMIVATAFFYYNPEQALYALVALFVTGRTINLINVGGDFSTLALIITRETRSVQHAILTEVNRGVTRISAFGGYTEEARPILMCVVDQQELTHLKDVVRTHDPDAFVIVTSANEVLGQGFQAMKR